MPDLRFALTGAEAPPNAAVPQLRFTLHVTNSPPEERIQSVMLRCQIQITATHRGYCPETKAQLADVFGAPERWRETLRAFLWANTTIVIPGFTGETTVDVPVPFTYDFEVIAAKYFDALDDGVIPLEFLFSGTVFYEKAVSNTLQVAQISWEREAEYRLPVALWREMIARYYPNTAWMRLDKDIFDRLYAYKLAHGLPTWEQALTHLLDAVGAEPAHAATSATPASSTTSVEEART